MICTAILTDDPLYCEISEKSTSIRKIITVAFRSTTFTFCVKKNSHSPLEEFIYFLIVLLHLDVQRPLNAAFRMSAKRCGSRLLFFLPWGWKELRTAGSRVHKLLSTKSILKHSAEPRYPDLFFSFLAKVGGKELKFSKKKKWRNYILKHRQRSTKGAAVTEILEDWRQKKGQLC